MQVDRRLNFLQKILYRRLLAILWQGAHPAFPLKSASYIIETLNQHIVKSERWLKLIFHKEIP